jgi:hypothetical protein
MKVLRETPSPQSISIIPRTYPSQLTITVRDDMTDTTVISSTLFEKWENYDLKYSNASTVWSQDDQLSFYLDNDYLVVEYAYQLNLNNFYDLTLQDQLGNVIYKDKIFCTDQNVDSYSVNNYLIPINELDIAWNLTDNKWDDDDTASIYISAQTYDNEYILL